MNMIGKFASSLVAVGAFSAIIFASTSTDSMKSAQRTVAAAAEASQSGVELFSYASEFTRLVEEPTHASGTLNSMRAEEPSPSSGPLNSKETPQDQLNDLQYN